jgi:hypothetical protein
MAVLVDKRGSRELKTIVSIAHLFYLVELFDPRDEAASRSTAKFALASDGAVNVTGDKIAA